MMENSMELKPIKSLEEGIRPFVTGWYLESDFVTESGRTIPVMRLTLVMNENRFANNSQVEPFYDQLVKLLNDRGFHVRSGAYGRAHVHKDSQSPTLKILVTIETNLGLLRSVLIALTQGG